MKILIKKLSSLLALLTLPAMLAACAAVQHIPAQLQPAPAESAQVRTLARTVDITLDTGYARTLKAGSLWQPAGTVTQGGVYRPVNDVFTLEGAHIHEAYLVVSDGLLVGFYLPAERGYSPLHATVPVSFTHP